jgi:capsular polysaccharide biosynthesis protein
LAVNTNNPSALLTLKSTALRCLNAFYRIASGLPSIGRFRPIRGSFSAKTHLVNGNLEGRLLSDCQPAGPCPHGSMTEKAGFHQNNHQPWPIFWVRSDNARLVGRMLQWRDQQDRLCEECVYGLTERRRLGEDRLHAQILVPTPLPLPGAWTTISSNWNDGGNYYHWMLDGLTRLSLRDTLPEKTKILLPTDLPRFARETIELLGLEKDSLAAPSICVRPERYYFCAPTAMTGVWNPDGYKWLRKNFAPYFAPPRSGPPVFLTRRHGARIPENLAAIESIFQSHSFDIVDCATISVREQIRKISSATAVAGLHGAAMTNLLWAYPETPVIEIFQPGYLNGCYEQIAKEGNLHYEHVIISNCNLQRTLLEWCHKV